MKSKIRRFIDEHNDQINALCLGFIAGAAYVGTVALMVRNAEQDERAWYIPGEEGTGSKIIVRQKNQRYKQFNYETTK